MFFLITLLGQSCLSIEGEKILASHLATQVESLRAAPPDATFGFTPRFGTRRIIPGFEIAAFARKQGIVLNTTNEICVTRPARSLEAATLLDHLKIASQKLTSADDIQIELIDHSRHALPKGEIEFARTGLTFSSDGITLWRGFIRTSTGSRFPLWAKIKIQIAGEPLTAKMLAPRKEVKAGDIVAVEVIHGNARLSLDAKAETSGSSGERIFLKNPASGRRFEAKITGSGRATVGGNHAN